MNMTLIIKSTLITRLDKVVRFTDKLNSGNSIFPPSHYATTNNWFLLFIQVESKLLLRLTLSSHIFLSRQFVIN